MAHLKNFGVGNFRAFKDLYNFEFAPITVLTGTNSSGKSSLIKALLLLRESTRELEKDFKIENLVKLNFNQDLQLGNFDTTKNVSLDSDFIEFNLPFKLPNSNEDLVLKLKYGSDESNLKNGVLHSFLLIKKSDKEELVRIERTKDGFHDSINYSNLWKIIEDSMNKKKAIDDLKSKSERLNFSEWEILNTSEWKKNLNEERDLEMEFPYYLFNDSENRLSKNIYFNSLYKGKNRVEETDNFLNSTFLNYLFLLDEADVKKNIKNWYPKLLNKEIKTLLIDYYAAKQTIEKERGDLSAIEFIRMWELNTLDSFKDTCNLIDYDGIESNNHLLFASSFEVLLNMKLGIMKSGPFNPNIVFAAIENSNNTLSKILANPNLILNQKSYKNFEYSPLGTYFIFDFFYGGIKTMLSFLSNALANMEFIPCVRGSVKRFYINSPNESFFHTSINEFHSSRISDEALLFFEKYLKLFGIADSIKLTLAGDSTFTRVELTKDNKLFQLADVGYGYTQLLPILLKIVTTISEKAHYRYEGTSEAIEEIVTYSPSIVIIEEPETNLHPALQSKLADMFVECYKKYNIQLIIETHSEYLIRKLQYLTAKKDINSDFTQLYYFHTQDDVLKGKKQIKKINIHEDGRLSADFGSGFFDETTKLIEGIWEARNLN